MPELDPTRTRLLRDEYAKVLTQLTATAMKRVLDTLESEPVNERMIEKLQAIIDQDIGASAKPIIDRITRLAYQRGTDYADRKLKAEGIQFSITRAAPVLQFAEVTVPFTPQNITVLDPETLQTLKGLSLDLVKKLSDEIKGKLASEIRQGILRSEHPRVIAKRFEDIAKMSKYRAEMIARTETIRAFNTAAEARYKAAGVKRWKWLAAMDERMCSICGARDGKIYEMGDEIPPIHPHCRCCSSPQIDRVKPEKKETAAITQPEKTFNLATIDDFNKAKDQVPESLKRYLSIYTENEIIQYGIKLYLSENKKSGYGLKGDEIINVFSIEKGSGAKAMRDAIKNGGRKLDCFDKQPNKISGLPDYYAKFGFKEYKREKNWTPGEPDVVYMKWDPEQE